MAPSRSRISCLDIVSKIQDPTIDTAFADFDSDDILMIIEYDLIFVGYENGCISVITSPPRRKCEEGNETENEQISSSLKDSSFIIPNEELKFIQFPMHSNRVVGIDFIHDGNCHVSWSVNELKFWKLCTDDKSRVEEVQILHDFSHHFQDLEIIGIATTRIMGSIWAQQMHVVCRDGTVILIDMDLMFSRIEPQSFITTYSLKDIVNNHASNSISVHTVQYIFRAEHYVAKSNNGFWMLWNDGVLTQHEFKYDNEPPMIHKLTQLSPTNTISKIEISPDGSLATVILTSNNDTMAMTGPPIDSVIDNDDDVYTQEEKRIATEMWDISSVSVNLFKTNFIKIPHQHNVIQFNYSEKRRHLVFMTEDYISNQDIDDIYDNPIILAQDVQKKYFTNLGELFQLKFECMKWACDGLALYVGCNTDSLLVFYPNERNNFTELINLEKSYLVRLPELHTFTKQKLKGFSILNKKQLVDMEMIFTNN
ncbi:hypothetical protein C9374_008467 [Naegleria lovaniensis]|uniref:Uncharacterized protein n=1 Tax=Naegleria lovaniensis TaxID=51637 RepID=A0AA88GFB1_NAELO|nr:uncharacterized protein C9374_008467 [Naegleria lovaniensis]KAG2378324.1 hypothetical protein C9374_008467 [Naegleria lovaniensis]